jgi:hypothetical protein
MNRYSYVTNNPLRYVDPTGHMQEDGYVGNQKPLDCKKYPQYCVNGKPKSSKQLLAMRARRPTPKGPMCTTASQCVASSSQTNPASYYPTINSYYWSSAAYGEQAYYAATRLSLAKNGINYGLSGSSTFGLGGRYYTPGTINGAITNGFAGLNALGFSFATAAIGNIVDYGFGANADKGFGQEFAVSTAVDTVLTYAVGAAVAVGVGAVLGASAAPLAVVGVTALVATGTMMALDRAGVPAMLKANTNDFINYLQGD